MKKYIDIVLIVLVSTIMVITLFLQFYQDKTLHNSIETANELLLNICATLLLAFASVIVFTVKDTVFKIDLPDVIIFCLLIYLVVNTLILSNIETKEFNLAISYMMLYFGIRIVGLKFDKFRDLVLILILLAGICESILTLCQLYGYSNSNHSHFVVTGNFINPGPLGIYLGAILLVALTVLKKHKFSFKFNLNSLKFCLSFIAATFTSIAVLATLSRAAWLGIAIAIGILFRREIAVVIKNSSLSKLFISLVAVILLSSTLYSVYLFKRDSADGRLFIWQNSLVAWTKAPLFGVGCGNFAEHYAQSQIDYFEQHGDDSPMTRIADSPCYVFNEYLSALLLLGSVGLGIIIFILLKILNSSKNSCFIFGIVVILIAGFFSYPFYVVPIGSLFIIMIALRDGGEQIRLSKYIVGGISLLLLAFGLYLNHDFMDKLRSNREWHLDHLYYSMKDYASVVEDYELLYPYLKSNSDFIFEYGHALSKCGNPEESTKILIAGSKLNADPMFFCIIGNNYSELGNYKRAQEAYERAYHMCPNRLYPLYLTAKLHLKYGRESEARSVARRALQKKIKVDSPAIREMQKEFSGILK